MDALLKLKLEMVYRNLSTEEAQKRFSEATTATPPPPPPKPKTVVKRKVVKALVPKST